MSETLTREQIEQAREAFEDEMRAFPPGYLAYKYAAQNVAICDLALQAEANATGYSASVEPSAASPFDGLRYVVQYRRKDDGTTWCAMAAFDEKIAADNYVAECGGEGNRPWEYRVLTAAPQGK